MMAEKEMKILILIPGLPVDLEQIRGGIHSALINLLHGFASVKNIDIRVISFNKDLLKTKTLKFADNISIYYEHEGIFPFHSLNYFFFGSGKLKYHVKDFSPDVIHFQVGNTFLFIKLFVKINCPVVLTIHGMSNEEAKRKTKLSDKITWRFNSLMNSFLIPEHIIHLSSFSKSKTKNFNFKNEVIIHNAVPLKYFQIPLKKKTDNTLLYIGVIDNNKNLLFLLNILKKMNDLHIFYRLEVLGGYSNSIIQSQIEHFIDTNNLSSNIQFHGWVLQEKVIELISKSDILVVSSKHESLPMAIAESMASGKVVIASDVGGIPEMITNETDGFLFNLSKESQIIEPLKKLHNNFNLIASIAENAKKSASDKFDCEKVAERTISFYKKIN